ncbi:MAG: NAD(P)H-dependent oxidoreductase [Myxococcales bacterium]|nr:NAD(P)H-dependent oxidoreductase [Myxococcales bacterium]
MTTMTLVTAHPDPQSFSRSLANAYARGATAQGVTVRHFDATELRFDPVLRGAHTTPMHDEPDLAKLREAVDASAHVAWFFPTWWAGLPAALKGLVDRLFLPKVSFVYEGGLPRGLLKGRSSRYVATMDSPALWYWLAHHDALGGSFGRGTLQFVGFGLVQRTLVYRVRSLSEAARSAWLQRLEALGASDAQRLLARQDAGRLPERVGT